ncbi:MAG: hypothetical protein QQN51_04415 [Nitrosopumilus sp.]
MSSADVVDKVNALLKLGVGDPYRLEHIKQAYILNSTIWKSDERYLEQLQEKYLVKHHVEQLDVQPETDENLESGSENKNMIHCWKCGKKSLFEANFCMVCGSSLFEVGTESQTVDVKVPSAHSKNQRKTMGLKIPIMIGIPVLILVILGVGYSQGSFDYVLEKQVMEETMEETTETVVEISKTQCGPGTIPKDGVCILDERCGPGTIFDEDSYSCILDK